MALATELTLELSRPLVIDNQPHTFRLSLTYRLDQADADVTEVALGQAAHLARLQEVLCRSFQDGLPLAAPTTTEEQTGRAAVRERPLAAISGSRSCATRTRGNGATCFNGAAAHAHPPAGRSPEKPLERHAAHSGSSRTAGVSPQTSATSGDGVASASEPPMTTPQKLAIQAALRRLALPEDELAQALMAQFGKSSLHALTKAEAASLLRALERDSWEMIPGPTVH